MAPTRFVGDDLIDLLKVNRPINSENIEIVNSVVQIGCLTFEEHNPVYPYIISARRDKAAKLDVKNVVSMGVYYKTESGEVLFQTCKGKMILPLNPQIIKGGCCE